MLIYFYIIIIFVDGKFVSAPSPRHSLPLNMVSYDENNDERENENESRNENRNEHRNENDNDSLNNIDNDSNISIMNSLVNFDASCWSDGKVRNCEVPTLKSKNSPNKGKKLMKSLGSSLHRRSSAEPVGSKKVVGRKYLNKSLDNRQVEAILKPLIAEMSNIGADLDVGADNIISPIGRDNESANGTVDQDPGVRYGLSPKLGPGQGQGLSQGPGQGHGFGQTKGPGPTPVQGLVKKPNQMVVVKNTYKLNESFDDSVLNSMYDDGVNQDSNDTPHNYRDRYNFNKDDVEGELQIDG